MYRESRTTLSSLPETLQTIFTATYTWLQRISTCIYLQIFFCTRHTLRIRITSSMVLLVKLLKAKSPITTHYNYQVLLQVMIVIIGKKQNYKLHLKLNVHTQIKVASREFLETEVFQGCRRDLSGLRILPA